MNQNIALAFEPYNGFCRVKGRTFQDRSAVFDKREDAVRPESLCMPPTVDREHRLQVKSEILEQKMLLDFLPGEWASNNARTLQSDTPHIQTSA